jgi:hypothetical protein
MCQLPRELSEEQQKAVMREWVGGLNARGLVVDWSLHTAPAADGLDNPHAHCMVATRSLDGKDPQGFGKKWAGDPAIETAGRHKSPLDDAKTLARLKEEFTEITNRHLEAAGSDVRITHLSNEARGIEAVGGVHKGKDATAREKKGEKSYLAKHNRRVAFDNATRAYDHADGWQMPPTVEKEDWHKQFAEWQLIRGSMIAARDASQKSQSNVIDAPATRSLRNIDAAREQAKLSIRQNRTFQEREQSRSQERGGPER